jgi:protein TonB
MSTNTNPQVCLSRGKWRNLAWGAAMALVLNLAFFSLMPVLLDPSSDEIIYEQVVPQVNVVRIKRNEIDVKRKTVKPQERHKKQRPKMRQEKSQPIMSRLAIPFEVNPRLPAGPQSLELPPMETLPFDMDIVQETYEMNQLDEPLTPLAKIPPIYPGRAKRRGIEGFVEVEFVVNKQGVVENILILKSDPPEAFDSTVIKTVSKWRFKPGTIAGIPVKTRVKAPFEFDLGD